MSKIICDVCGTSYQETSTQCPICGCVRSGEPVTVSGDTNDVQVSPVITYTHVRGGRFSKANVKKRNAGVPVYSTDAPKTERKKKESAPQSEKDSKKGEKILIVTVIVLLLAIAAVVVYIAGSIMGIDTPQDAGGAETTTTAPTTQPTETTEPSVPEVPCEGISLTETVVELSAEGESVCLMTVVTPENQTDEIVFVSEDETVAVVDDVGRVEAVGVGQTIIHATCGTYEATCRVVCSFQEETTAPTVPEGNYVESDLKFADNGFGYEYTIGFSEGSYNPYVGNIPAELVTFTSSNENRATVDENGLVTFVGRGMVEITATYGEWEITAIFRIQ